MASDLPPSELMEVLLKDPVKKALLLQLLNKEKHNIEKYKRELSKTKTTPLFERKKVIRCESPTALQRRRALLEQQNQSSSTSSSEFSDVPSEEKGPKMPFHELLRGVKAYIDVKRDNVDKSEGIKAIMKLMGATIRDTFTNDVTHVIFKDGSFSTFEKAKLMRTHLVSILWLDAVRRNNARVPEKNYPAFGSKVCEQNVSILCSQIQKDYEGLVKEERRRRHTMAASKTSMSSYLSAFPISDDESISKEASPELTSDDSDCGVIDGFVTKRPKDNDLLNDKVVKTPAKIVGALKKNHVRRATINASSSMEITPNVSSEIRSSEEIVEATPKKVVNIKKVEELNAQSKTSFESVGSDRTESGLNSSGIGGTRKRSSSRVSLRKSNAAKNDASAKKQEDAKKVVERISEGLTDTDKTRSDLNSSETGRSSRVSTRKKNSQREKSISKDLENTETVSDIRPSLGSLDTDKTKSDLNASDNGSRSSNIPSKKNNTQKEKSLSKEKVSDSRTSLGSMDTDKTKSDLNVSQNRSESSKTSRRKNKQNEESPSKVFKELSLQSSVMSSLRVSDSDKTKSDLGSSKNSRKTKSSLVKGKENSSLVSLNTTMSSLRLSESKSTEDRSTRGSGTRSESSNTSINVAEPGKKSRRKTMAHVPATSKSQETPRTPKPKAKVSDKNSGTPKQRTRKAIIDSSESEVEAEVNSGKRHKQTNNEEPATEALPNTRRSLRRSLFKVPSNSDVQNDDKSEATPKSAKKSKEVRRSLSESRAKANDDTPSPPKSRRIVQSSTEKKRRKLYNPQDMSVFVTLEDIKEREEHQKHLPQKDPSDTFLDPNYISSLVSRRKPKKPDRDIHSDDELSTITEQKEKETERSKQKTKKKKSPAKPTNNGDADEQHDLLNLLNQSVNVNTRYSQRLSMSEIQPKYTFSSGSSISSENLPITPIKRRSTLDFVPLSLTQQKRKLKLDPKRTTSVVCTKLHRHQVVEFENAVAKLGRFFVEDNVTKKTSHLVVGEPKRTLNILKAIARGCWILKHEWLLDSCQREKWLNEEDYELTEFSPAVQQCRMQREAFGPMYSMDIFEGCGFIFLAKDTTPKPADLKDLILLCKGKVTTVLRNASVVVGEVFEREGLNCVNEMWVLDSIQFNKLKSFKHYLLKSGNANVTANSPHF